MVTPKRAGVIGHPIAQSLSPALHALWNERYGITASYEKVDGLSEEKFPQIVRDCQQAGWNGLNVTIPFKGSALALADQATDTATAIGAANFLRFENGQIIADNTDCLGFIAAVEASGWALSRDTAMVIGAGGAAPAIVKALELLGFKQVLLTNRTHQKALEIKNRFDIVTVVDWADRDAALATVDLLVNATSLGMKGERPLPLHVDELKPGAAVMDIVTTPDITPLMEDAAARGHPVMNGVPMLVYQAVPCFAHWHGVTPTDIPEAIAFLRAHLAAKP